MIINQHEYDLGLHNALNCEHKCPDCKADWKHLILFPGITGLNGDCSHPFIFPCLKCFTVLPMTEKKFWMKAGKLRK